MAQVKVDLEGKSVDGLLREGNRAYFLGNFAAAVAFLSRCAEQAVAERGDGHESLGHIYFCYGRALLELAREDGDLLGDVVPKDVAVEVDVDEDDALAGGDGHANQDETDEAKAVVEGSSEGVEFNGEADESARASELEDSGKNDSKTESDDDGKNEEEEEDDDVEDEDIEEETSDGKAETKQDEPSDLQVAWEVLELARMIFFKNPEPQGREMLANTLILLGEVSLESENFDNAISDIRQGLEIQEAIFDGENRKLAETYYKLGMALATNNQIDEAIETFNMTIEHLAKRIGKLEKSERDVDRDEVQEMKQLIPEVEEKIADMKLCKEEAAKKLAADQDVEVQASPEKKATDISHLVKRKRSLNDSSEGSSSPAKKLAADSS